MQFAVPQFTDVEDKIIGPLTLKQFMVIVAAGGLCLLFWSLPIPKIAAIFIDLPIAIVGIALAFANYNGRPALTYIFPFVNFLVAPKLLVFKREPNSGNVVKKESEKKVEKEIPKAVLPDEQDSRLRKLAYLLDQKNVEQEELITKGVSTPQVTTQVAAAPAQAPVVTPVVKQEIVQTPKSTSSAAGSFVPLPENIQNISVAPKPVKSLSVDAPKVPKSILDD